MGFLLRTVILTHGDTDGVCSGAMALKAFPGAILHFSKPVGLLEDLSIANEGDRVIICDIAINEIHCEELVGRLERLSEEGEVFYIDHHPPPRRISRIPGKVSYSDPDACASEMTYYTFRDLIPEDMDLVAIFGAVGDYADRTPGIRRLMDRWDERLAYMESGILSQAVIMLGRNYDAKRRVIRELVEMHIPSTVDWMLELALKQCRVDLELREEVKRKLIVLENLAYVVNPHGPLGKAASFAAAFGHRKVGVAVEIIKRRGKMLADMSIRALEDLDLNDLVRELTPKLGGEGGGHSRAAGARLPEETFKEFLRYLDSSL